MMEHSNKLSELLDAMCAFPTEQELAPESVLQMSEELKEKQAESRTLQTTIDKLLCELTQRKRKMQARTEQGPIGMRTISGFFMKAPTHNASPAIATMQSVLSPDKGVGSESTPTTVPAHLSGLHPRVD